VVRLLFLPPAKRNRFFFFGFFRFRRLNFSQCVVFPAVLEGEEEEEEEEEEVDPIF
jgi:hypothetical protein